MSTSGAGTKAVRSLAAAYLIFAVAFALFCTVANLRHHYTIPSDDDWRILDNLFAAPSVTDWVFTDQVGHRFPMTLFLLYLDYTYFSAHMHLLAVAALACTWGAAAGLTLAVRAERGTLAPVDRAACAFCLFCLLWAGTGYDLVWGVNQGSQQTTALFALSLAAFAYYQSRRRAEPHPGARLPAAAGAAAFLATFSHGMGAASWAGLGFASLVARLRWRVLAAFVAAGAASVALYGRGLEHVPYGSFWVYLRFLRRAPTKIVTFWLAFIGNPVVHVVDTTVGLTRGQALAVGTLAGAAGVALFVSYALYLWRRRLRASAIESVCAGLMAFTLAGGVLVALNRFMFPSNAVSSRFLTWTTLFWIGAVLAVVRLARQRPWGDGFAIVVLWVVSLAMIPAVLHAFRWQERVRQNLARHAAMHLSAVRWDKLARVGINPNSDPVYRVAERMRRDRRGFFAGGRGELPGTRLAERFAVAPERRCAGKIEHVQEIEARDGPAAMVGGTLGAAAGGEAPSYVVLSDAGGVIRGIGELLPGGGAGRAWVGFVADFSAAAPYTAYGVLGDQGAVCALASWSGLVFKGRPVPR